MKKEFENGYAVDAVAKNNGFSVYVFNPVGVRVAVKHGLTNEESALLIGEAMADAYFAGYKDGIEHLTNRVRALMKEYGY